MEYFAKLLNSCIISTITTTNFNVFYVDFMTGHHKASHYFEINEKFSTISKYFHIEISEKSGVHLYSTLSESMK